MFLFTAGGGMGYRGAVDVVPMRTPVQHTPPVGENMGVIARLTAPSPMSTDLGGQLSPVCCAQERLEATKFKGVRICEPPTQDRHGLLFCFFLVLCIPCVLRPVCPMALYTMSDSIAVCPDPNLLCAHRARRLLKAGCSTQASVWSVGPR